MEAAQYFQSPVIIRTSFANSINYSRGPHNLRLTKTTKAIDNNASAAVSGAEELALHVRKMALEYNVPVILQSETLCLYQLTTWFENMLLVNEKYLAEHKEPLYSSHVINFPTSIEHENLAIACKYFERLVQVNLWLEYEMNMNIVGPPTEGEVDDKKNHAVSSSPPLLYLGGNSSSELKLDEIDPLYQKNQDFVRNVYETLPDMDSGFSISVFHSEAQRQSYKCFEQEGKIIVQKDSKMSEGTTISDQTHEEEADAAENYASNSKRWDRVMNRA